MSLAPVADLCGQELCTNVASHRMFWPGSRPTLLCPEHKDRAEAVAEAMGLDLVVVPLDLALRA